MFIPKPIDKIDFNKNVLKINETTTIKFNKCDLDVELIESLISKGAYASTLLYLNSKCLVENINGEILTKDSYSNYLQECKDLLKENVYETTASGFRQLCNINGLEILENNKFVARGKTKLYVENFKEEYFPDLVMNIISEFNESEMSRDDYMNALNKISELEWENKISTDDYDRANKKLNKIYIDSRNRNVEPVNESCEECDECLDIVDIIHETFDKLTDEESAKSLLQSLNSEVKSLADKYNVVLDEINECEGTQTTDIAPKLDQEVGRLVKPPKQDDLKEGYDFNVGFNHKFKGFILTEQGRYERGNFVLVKENGNVKAISKNKLKENSSKVRKAKIIDEYGNSVWDYNEVIEVQAPRLIKDLNNAFGEEYDFGFRVEDESLVVFDKNENFDFSYMDEKYAKADRIVKNLFGKQCYLEAQISVIGVIAGMIVKDLN